MSKTNTWSARLPIVIGYFALIGLFGGFATWAVYSQIAGAIIAPGRIEVDQNRQVVQHQTGGVVSEILVSEGDSVKAGDVLLRLDGQSLVSNLTIVEAQLYDIQARRGRLEAERDGTETIKFDDALLAVGLLRDDIQELIDGQNNLFYARRDTAEREAEQLGKRREQISSQVDGILAQKQSLATQVSLIQKELKNQKELLEKQLTQASTVLALERQEANLTGQLGELSANKANHEGRITELEIQILRLNTSRREESISLLRDSRSLELELIEQRAALLTEIEQLAIRAPVSGIVYGMRVQTPRSVIQTADPVLFIIPQDRPLLIVSRVDPINIDQILIGQQVNLRFSALDQRTTPELVGKVTLISADSFEDETVGIAYYRAEIVLNPGEISKLEAGVVLIPGMPVETFIRTTDRSPLEYLIKPLATYFNRAFRES